MALALCAWLQDDRYAAWEDRAFLDVLAATGGFTGMVVAPDSGLNLTIGPGRAVVPGTSSAGQGKYLVQIETPVTLTITPDALPRNLDVIVWVDDLSAVIGATDQVIIDAIPINAPHPPSSLVIATLAIPGGTATITAGMIGQPDNPWELAVGSIGTDGIRDGEIGTSQLVNEAVTNSKLRHSDATSAIGRVANLVGPPDDINAGVDGHVLRRSGTAIGFGILTPDNIPDGVITTTKRPDATSDSDGVTNAKLRHSTACSVIGRYANSAGQVLDIGAGSDGVLRRDGNVIGFGQVANGGIDSIGAAKLGVAENGGYGPSTYYSIRFARFAGMAIVWGWVAAGGPTPIVVLPSAYAPAVQVQAPVAGLGSNITVTIATSGSVSLSGFVFNGTPYHFAVSYAT